MEKSKADQAARDEYMGRRIKFLEELMLDLTASKGTPSFTSEAAPSEVSEPPEVSDFSDASEVSDASGKPVVFYNNWVRGE